MIIPKAVRRGQNETSFHIRLLFAVIRPYCKEVSMNKEKTEAIVAQLITNADGLRFGTVSVTAKLHDGRVVEVMYTKTEQTREPKPKIENNH